MKQQVAINDLIRRIYNAVIEPDEWNNILAILAENYKSTIATNLEQNILSGEGNGYQSLGFTAQELQDYEQYYGPRSILFKNIRDYTEGTVFTDQMVPNYEEYRASETYNDFHKKKKADHGLGLITSNSDEWMSYIVLRRSEKVGFYTKDEIEMSNLLVPHLLQATKMAREIERKDVLYKSFEEAFNKLAVGIVLITKSSHVIYANDVAETIFSRNDGLRTVRQYLTAKHSTDNAALRTAIEQIFEMLSGDSIQAAKPVLINRTQSFRPYQLSIMPLIQELLPANSSHEHALVIINDPESTPINNEEMIATLYQLTLAEARVAQALCNGLSVSEMAVQLKASDNTIRFHIKNIFQKLHVKRQSEVVSLILNGPISLLFQE
jgi:DNA-binding CsgD family transcriptional regulator